MPEAANAAEEQQITNNGTTPQSLCRAQPEPLPLQPAVVHLLKIHGAEQLCQAACSRRQRGGRSALVFQAEEEAGAARVALPPGAPPKLVVDAPCLLHSPPITSFSPLRGTPRCRKTTRTDTHRWREPVGVSCLCRKQPGMFIQRLARSQSALLMYLLRLRQGGTIR